MCFYLLEPLKLYSYHSNSSIFTFLKLKSPAGSFLLLELELLDLLELEGRTFSLESSDLFLLGLFT